MYCSNLDICQGAKLPNSNQRGHFVDFYQFYFSNQIFKNLSCKTWKKKRKDYLAGKPQNNLTKILCRINSIELLHEVKGCVNLRPLTFVGGELESGKPLTLFHFLVRWDSFCRKARLFLKVQLSKKDLKCGICHLTEVMHQAKKSKFGPSCSLRAKEIA